MPDHANHPCNPDNPGNNAEILLEVATGGEDRILTYLVPEGLLGQIRPGVRVVVPVGGRKAAGIVLAIGVETPQVKLRPIAAVLSPEPAISRTGAELADYITARYLCRRCDAWRLFLPPGTAKHGRRRVAAAVDRGALAERLSRFILPSEEASLLAATLLGLGREGQDPARIKAALGPFYRQVEELLAEGVLTWREPWQRKAPGAKKITLIRAARSEPGKLPPKQARVLSYLAERPGKAATRAEILASCGVGPDVLARMAARDLVIFEELAVARVPVERAGSPREDLLELNQAQAQAVDWVRGRLGTGGIMLLHGVTGSGKTEVYLRALELACAAGRRGLLLVPEIGLTPQTVERVVARFGERVAVLHSRMSPGERRDEWERVRAGEADILVGPRSALFAPLEGLGLVILDEEHDGAYKQEDGVRYHAREVAAELCRLTGSVLILGSATPSLEAMAACARGDADYRELPERTGGRPLPRVELVDLRAELREKRLGALSARLRGAVESCLAAREQVILFLNRRGYATFVNCRECGQAMRCPHCEVALTYHQGGGALLCHYCGYTRPVPDICPNCQGRRIRYFGLGTERLCEEVRACFPGARVLRMDQDSTTRRGAHQEIYRALRREEVDILVGTQMVTKGLDLPRVTLVGVVAADAGLNLPDFRAAERTFQLLTQVAGRAGRGDRPGLVILQTYNPEHYSLACAAGHDYHRFHAQEAEMRRAANYPPYAEMLRIGLTSPDERAVSGAAEELAVNLGRLLGGSAEILGPVPALIRKVENRYRYHLLLKAPSLAPLGPTLLQEVARLRGVRRTVPVQVILDVNPSTVI